MTHRHKLWQKLLSEVVGTFVLTLASTSTAILVKQGVIPIFVHAVAPALAVLALVYALGNVSGAHFNPIVSVAFAFRRVFPARLILPYIVAQIAGSVLAALLVTRLGDPAAATTKAEI